MFPVRCGPNPYLDKLFPVRCGPNPYLDKLAPASRKRRRKGNAVVSDETAIYGYKSSATLTTARLNYKLQTRPLVREDAPRQRAKERKEKSVHGPQRGS
jgi:hypothetical protein